MSAEKRNLDSKPENGVICVIHVRKNASSKIQPFTERSWKVVCEAANNFGDTLCSVGMYVSSYQ